HEDENCHVRAPVIRQILVKGQMEAVTLDDFIKVCLANHSTMDHVRRLRLEMLGLSQDSIAGEEERGAAFAGWLWGKRNARGESVLELLEFVLDGGPAKELPNRIFEAT